MSAIEVRRCRSWQEEPQEISVSTPIPLLRRQFRARAGRYSSEKARSDGNRVPEVKKGQAAPPGPPTHPEAPRWWPGARPPPAEPPHAGREGGKTGKPRCFEGGGESAEEAAPSSPLIPPQTLGFQFWSQPPAPLGLNRCNPRHRPLTRITGTAARSGPSMGARAPAPPAQHIDSHNLSSQSFSY